MMKMQSELYQQPRHASKPERCGSVAAWVRRNLQIVLNSTTCRQSGESPFDTSIFRNWYTLEILKYAALILF